MSFLLLNSEQNRNNPKSNKDYKHWEGSFKGYSPEELLALSDEELQVLCEEFLETDITGFSLWSRYYTKYKNFISNEKVKTSSLELEKELKSNGGNFLRYTLKNMLKDIKYTENGEVQIFRTIWVNEIGEINFDNLGICWTYNPKNISLLEDIHLKKTKDYKIRFAGTTPSDNIDWIYSLFLDIETGYNQELRVYNPKKVFLTGYLSIDSKTNTLYSKYGDVSYISKGIIQ